MASMIRLALLLAILVSPASAQEAPRTESDYRNLLCDGMLQERTLPNGTRVDCLTDEHAIEVDWAPKWHQAIGQAMSYAATTERRPAIILICKVKAEACLRFGYLAEEAVAYWRVPMTVWQCPQEARKLTDCFRWDVK